MFILLELGIPVVAAKPLTVTPLRDWIPALIYTNMGFFRTVSVEFDFEEGNAARRIRYHSEGEDPMARVTSLTHGPLPDIIPVSPGQAVRERSLSAADIESLQRQRAIERAAGRELRYMADDLVRDHEAARGNRNLGLAAVHAELNGMTSLFLSGMRRLLYLGLAAYYRHLLHWTRQPGALDPPDSCVDEQR